MGAKNSIISGPLVGTQLSCIGNRLVMSGRPVYNLVSYQLLDEKSKIDGLSAVSRAAIGTYLLGPAGMIAGATAKHNNIYLVSLVFSGSQQENVAEVDENIYRAIITTPKQAVPLVEEQLTKQNDYIQPQTQPAVQVPLVNGPANSEALLKRGDMALEDGEWDKAISFYNAVLNLDAECGAAYFGIVKAKLRVFSNADFETAYKYARQDDVKELKYAIRFNDSIAAFIGELDKKYSDDKNSHQRFLKLIGDKKHRISADYLGVWGVTDDGLLTHIGKLSKNVSVLPSHWNNLASVVSHTYHIVGLKTDGTVVAAGNNNKGQLNVSAWSDIVSVDTDYGHTLGLKRDGTVLAAGNNNLGQCNVNAWRNIKKIATGDFHSVGLREDGTVVATGQADFGQCDVSSWSDIIDIAADLKYTVGLRRDGTVLATGSNNDGQCNVSSWRDIISIFAEGSVTFGIRKDGTVITTGNYDTHAWANIIEITESYYTESNYDLSFNCMLGLKADGTILVAAEKGYENKSDIIKKEVGSWKLLYTDEEKAQLAAEKEAAKKRYEDYLAAHMDEVELLQARKKELERQIVEIKDKNERIRYDALNVPAAQKYAEKTKECFDVERELTNLGILDFKKKKELHQKLEKLNQEKSRLYSEEREQKKAVLATRDESLPIKEKELREIEKSIKEITRQAEVDSGYTPTTN